MSPQRQPVSAIFNRWWGNNYSQPPDLIYKLFFVTEVKDGNGKRLILIPNSIKKGAASRLGNFRAILLKFFNLFIKDTGKQSPLDLGEEYAPANFVDSPLFMKCDDVLGIGTFANKNFAKGDTIRIEGRCHNISEGSYKKKVKRDKITNLSESFKPNQFGEGKGYCCVNGAALFLNHACHPYANVSSEDYKILTFESEVDKGQQLFLYYGTDFFTKDNPCLNPLCCRKD